MKHRIEQTAQGLRIQAEAPPERQQKLLDELAQCAAGTCACPTPQYDKLTAIEVEASATGVTVTLQVRPGEQIDTADIEQCLAHTARQAGL